MTKSKESMPVSSAIKVFLKLQTVKFIPFPSRCKTKINEITYHQPPGRAAMLPTLSIRLNTSMSSATAQEEPAIPCSETLCQSLCEMMCTQHKNLSTGEIWGMKGWNADFFDQIDCRERLNHSAVIIHEINLPYWIFERCMCHSKPNGRHNSNKRELDSCWDDKCR